MRRTCRHGGVSSRDEEAGKRQKRTDLRSLLELQSWSDLQEGEPLLHRRACIVTLAVVERFEDVRRFLQLGKLALVLRVDVLSKRVEVGRLLGYEDVSTVRYGREGAAKDALES